MCTRNRPKKQTSGKGTRRSAATAEKGKETVADDTPAEVVDTPKEKKKGRKGKKSSTPPANKKAETVNEPVESKVEDDDEPKEKPKKKEKKGKQDKDAKELTTCEKLLGELEAHDDAWPFLHPVNTKQFPTYKKIIKKPMDLQTMRQRLSSGT